MYTTEKVRFWIVYDSYANAHWYKKKLTFRYRVTEGETQYTDTLKPACVLRVCA